MSEATATVDFGAPEKFGAHVFRVEIPATRTEPVVIVEDYGYRVSMTPILAHRVPAGYEKRPGSRWRRARAGMYFLLLDFARLCSCLTVNHEVAEPR
jgi:Protein of unknown function (DUF3780)